mmetsp:Transcript_18437/g.57185  ORF Transcript_18437/g.57185 Transcript_18437/m.57185 type:complete len:168 (-) Transcript_18437:92-595(-)
MKAAHVPVPFSHFPEHHLSLFGDLWQIRAIIVQHPEERRFVTLVRRGKTVFLLDNDEQPRRVSQQVKADGHSSELRFWLQRPAAIIGGILSPSPPYVAPDPSVVFGQRPSTAVASRGNAGATAPPSEAVRPTDRQPQTAANETTPLPAKTGTMGNTAKTGASKTRKK